MYRIRDLREDHDLSQKEVAAYLHITQQCYSKIETGRMDITGERLLLLAKLYGVTTDYLLGRTNNS
ncbi:MAG: helix-turn-helix transcriptional regulator [Clostridia bacterium]|nr:helix-turn-helix transcriptional regulator [Clostridia bacterium]